MYVILTYIAACRKVVKKKIDLERKLLVRSFSILSTYKGGE